MKTFYGHRAFAPPTGKMAPKAQKQARARTHSRNYNFECDWLIELSNNKLSDNNLASELVEFVIFMINRRRKAFSDSSPWVVFITRWEPKVRMEMGRDRHLLPNLLLPDDRARVRACSVVLVQLL